MSNLSQSFVLLTGKVRASETLRASIARVDRIFDICHDNNIM